MSFRLLPVPGAASLSRRSFLHTAGAALGSAMVQPARANHQALSRKPGEVILSRIPGLSYLPSYVMEKSRLVQKYAARFGLPDLHVRWTNFKSGDPQREALLSGEVDIIMSGLVPLLRLWDITGGAVKGIVGSGGMPLSLISTDPAIRSLRDVKQHDRIAVPVLSFSTQAVLLQMAASQMYGAENWRHFDENCVAMSHVAAFAMLQNRASAIRLHFSVPPYCYYERRRLREARVIARSDEITGGAHSNAHFYTTTRFAEAQPKIIDALRAAALEAKATIEKNTQDAVASYRALSGDKSDMADILDVLAEPGMMNWQLEPMGTLGFAQHLHRVGALSRKPESWRDYYLETSHGFAGS